MRRATWSKRTSTQAISKSGEFTRSRLRNLGLLGWFTANKSGIGETKFWSSHSPPLMNLDAIDALLTFLDTEVSSAVTELGKVAEGSRKHLQKLVYTNVVDRFDPTIDHLLIDNLRLASSERNPSRS